MSFFNFIKKNKEAETGIPEYFMEGADKSPKLIVDKDVIEEIENICTRIDNAISEHEVKIIELKDKRKQFEQIINSLEVKS